MNYLVQRGKVRSQMIQVPIGLPELLSDISREVLRCQPSSECLIQFVMDYLHSVMITREKALVVKSIIDRALQSVDDIIGQLCICDIGKEKAEQMAAIMEECFKNFLRKRRSERGRENEVIKFGEEDILDEMIRRCNFTVEQLQTSQPMIEEAYNRFVTAYMTAAERQGGTEALYQYFKARDEKRREEVKLFESARTIQSNWRGYITRKHLNLDKRMKICEELRLAEEDEARNKYFDECARIIQRFFKRISQMKGYLRQRKERELNLGACGASIVSLRPDSYPDRSLQRQKEDEVEVEEHHVPVPAPEALADIEEPTEPEATSEKEAEILPIQEAEVEPTAAPEVKIEVEQPAVETEELINEEEAEEVPEPASVEPPEQEAPVVENDAPVADAEGPAEEEPAE